MSVIKLQSIEGKGTPVDRSVDLCEAIKAACYEVGDGMALATVIGCLEIAKLEIMQEASE
jgi:hypothetical protein